MEHLKKTEIKLTNVARASLEELRLDYEDFLRQRNLPTWDRADPRRQSLIDKRPKTADDVALWVRELHDQAAPLKRNSPSGPATYQEIAANGALALLAVATVLLDRQIARLASDFETQGGFAARLYRVRQSRRRDE